jgi:hypothetical protein
MLLVASAALTFTAAAAAEPAATADPSIHGRNYTSHRTPGNHAFETPGGFHGHPRHGFEVGAHWDRSWPPALPATSGAGFVAGFRSGRCGVPWQCGNVPWQGGNVPWPLSNLDIEVEAE